MSDFLIRNARVVDGTGAPAFTADVRIEDGRITAIGDSLPDADIVVDAAGRYLAPGFIDARGGQQGRNSWRLVQPLARQIFRVSFSTRIGQSTRRRCAVRWTPVRATPYIEVRHLP